MAGTNGSSMQGIPPELVASLMAGGRSRNTYGPKLLEFVESDEPGINPREVWPVEFAQKKVETLYQGFMLAVNKAELRDQVIVRKHGEDLFLLHSERALAVAAAASEDS